MPRCGGSTPWRTSSTGISRPSRATGCGRACLEGPRAARARRHMLLHGGGGHQMERFRRVADRGGARVRGDARDPRADPRSARPVELARGARRPGLRGRGAAVRVRQQADDGRQYRIPPGDKPVVRSGAGAVALARARAGRGPGVHGCAGGGPRAAVRGRARRVRVGTRLRVPVARDHAGARARGLAVPPGRAGAEPRVGVARARGDTGPARGDWGRGDPDGDGAQSMDRYAAGGGMSPRTIMRTYFAITGLFNLAMSLIWGIDTLFKMGAGLDIQQVLLTNAAFTLGSMVFEVPTGVVADTIGRRVSLLLCL